MVFRLFMDGLKVGRGENKNQGRRRGATNRWARVDSNGIMGQDHGPE